MSGRFASLVRTLGDSWLEATAGASDDHAMDADAFLAELDAENRVALERIGAAAATAPGDGITVRRLLSLALKNELEATECAAAWIGVTPEIDVKLALARQAGDEAKHFRLIEKRLAEMAPDAGGAVSGAAVRPGALAPSGPPAPSGPAATPGRFEPGPRSSLLEYLMSLTTTVERVAAGQFTREALALVRNDEFIRFCEAQGDAPTAALYRDVIQPDERHHHDLGRRLLAQLAVDDATRDAARRACRRTLAMAEELQEIARMKHGISRAPGC